MVKSQSINPSEMNRVVECPHSYTLSKTTYYDPEIDYSKGEIVGVTEKDMGIIAHRYAAALLTGDDDDLKEIMDYPGFVNRGKKIAEATAYYINTVYDLIPPGGEIKVEHNLDLGYIYEGCHGRADCIIDAPDELFIIDLKYGRSDISTYQNWQLMAYAIGAEKESKNKHATISLVIVDGLKQTVDRRRITRKEAEECTEFIKERIKKALANVDERHGGVHCKYCPAQENCAPFWSWKTNKLEIGLMFNEMTPDDWQIVADWFYKTKDYESYRKIISEKINSGDIKNYEVVTTESRKWNPKKESQIVEYLKSKNLSEEQIYEKKLRSASQINQRHGIDIAKERKDLLKIEKRNKIVKK